MQSNATHGRPPAVLPSNGSASLTRPGTQPPSLPSHADHPAKHVVHLKPLRENWTIGPMRIVQWATQEQATEIKDVPKRVRSFRQSPPSFSEFRVYDAEIPTPSAAEISARAPKIKKQILARAAKLLAQAKAAGTEAAKKKILAMAKATAAMALKKQITA